MAEFPMYEEMAKKVAEKALDEILYDGKSIREWMQIIGSEDCISRQALQEWIKDKTFGDIVVASEHNFDCLPPVTPQPKTGHWIAIDEEPHEDYECDKCGYTIWAYNANIEPNTEYKYCPNCGCRMIEPQESEIHCNCTDAEIAKSFIEDVEAVKDLLPQESEVTDADSN